MTQEEGEIDAADQFDESPVQYPDTAPSSSDGEASDGEESDDEEGGDDDDDDDAQPESDSEEVVVEKGKAPIDDDDTTTSHLEVPVARNPAISSVLLDEEKGTRSASAPALTVTPVAIASTTTVKSRAAPRKRAAPTKRRGSLGDSGGGSSSPARSKSPATKRQKKTATSPAPPSVFTTLFDQLQAAIRRASEALELGGSAADFKAACDAANDHYTAAMAGEAAKRSERLQIRREFDQIVARMGALGCFERCSKCTRNIIDERALKAGNLVTMATRTTAKVPKCTCDAVICLECAHKYMQKSDRTKAKGVTHDFFWKCGVCMVTEEGLFPPAHGAASGCL